MFKNKFGDSIFKEKMRDLIKSDRYISELKVQATYNEVFRNLGEDRQKNITPEQKEKLLRELYKNSENAFIRKINALIDEYKHKDEKEEQEFVEKARRTFRNYCSDSGVKNEGQLSSEEIGQRALEEKGKENTFIGTLILLTRKYNSDKDELLLEYIDEFSSKYGTEDVISFISKAGSLYGLNEFEIESLKNHITGEDINPYICRRNIPLFNLYQFYKSDKYNEQIDPNDNGVIDLDDYAYITSSRALKSNVGIKWIINSHLDTYLVFASSHTSSNCSKLSQKLNDLLGDDIQNKSSDEEIENDEENKEQEDQEEQNPFYMIRRYAKKLSDLIQENKADISSTAQITSTEVDRYTTVLKKIIDGDSTEEETQKRLLKRIDDRTPTTTSDSIIDELIEKINDPTISITPRDILEELITDSKEVQISRNDKITALISQLGAEICNVLGISDQEKQKHVAQELYSAINSGRFDIKEKNEFFLPQLAKQLGIETAIFYKTTESEYGESNDITIDSIVNILREYKLVDDTRYHLTKNFIKQGEKYIVAKTFVKDKGRGNSIEMKQILEATEKYIKENYKGKGFSKKEADDTYKDIRIGIIKQSLFNKLVNNSDESNNTWGLIEDENGRLRLSPMFNFKSCAGCTATTPKVRVVDKNKNYIDDFLIVYSNEDWFKEWIDKAVINLDFDKAGDEMTRKTGVILTDAEKSFYRQTIFDKMHSIIVNASLVNYNTDEIIRARKDRMSMLQRLNYSRKNVRSRLSNQKTKIVDNLKPTKKRPDEDDQIR